MTSDDPTEESPVRIIPWTIPKPMGLWYQAFVVSDSGLFITPEMDVTTFEELKAAVEEGLDAVITNLTGHGRNKRPQIFALATITGVSANESAGTIHVRVADEDIENPMVRVPKREQLPKIARALTELIKRSRENTNPTN